MTMTFEEALESDPELKSEYEQSGFVEHTLEQLAARMDLIGITRSDLAEKMGVSPADVSKFFGDQNPKMKTVARYALALGCFPSVSLSHHEVVI